MNANLLAFLCACAALAGGSAWRGGELETQPRPIESELSRLSESYEQGYFAWTAEQYRILQRKEEASGSSVPIAVGLARCLDELGRYEEAIETLSAVREAGGASPDWQAAMGRALARVGRYTEAIDHCRAGIEKHPEHMEARLLLGELLELLGRKEEAIETYEWFDELLRESLPETADELVSAGRGLYRYSVLSRHPNLGSRTIYVLHELLQYAYERVDRRNWRARLASGNLLLSKHNLEEAVEEFRAALRLNPYLADAYVGLGRAALEEWDFENVERAVESALRHNPRHAGAGNLLAELRMLERKYDQAADACRDVLEINPNDPAALSTLAAAQSRMGRPGAAKRARARVAALSPDSALLEYTLGRWSAADRQFDEAREHLDRAIELAPEWVEPMTELGLMYMETGQERSAEKILKLAWELDSFNRRTYNTLDLLETLASFKTVHSEHFVFKYSEQRDAPVVPYLVRYMESIYEEVCGDYGVELTDKTVIEVFPTHAQFAVRITGRPWIHTIGASTGPVIAMDAPRPTSGYGAYFNWANVLRHEFTHTVTLAATKNHIPHWFTEGLAVWQEDSPRAWSWIQLLAGALRENRMFTLRTIDWGFIRPQRPNDRQLAYAQSEWMVEYLVQRWGFAAIGKLISAFREGLTQDQALGKVLEISSEGFSKDFVRWARRQAGTWGLPVEALPPQVWLKWWRLVRPDDAEAHSRLAESLLLSGPAEEAHRPALRALELDPNNVGALETLCRLVLISLEHEENPQRRRAIEGKAQEWTARLLELDARNHAGLKLAAQTAMDREREDRAMALYRRLKMSCPADPVSYRRLAALALERHDRERALGNLIDLWNYEADDADVPRQIAVLLAGRGQNHEALVWLERAVHIDPYRTDLHERLGALYSGFNRWEDAAVEYEVLSGLAPDNADHLARLAICYSRMGQQTKAQEAARRAVRLDSQSPARLLLNE
jgi:tetratricopeptide (TPR) repeat protein